MSEPAARQPRRARRQTLGRRLGLTPYYYLHETSDTRLVLQSAADANRRAGQWFILGSVGVGLLTPLSILFFFLSGTQGTGDAVFGACLSWPCLAVGILGAISGQALATTSNTITIDSGERTVVYEQRNRVNRLRRQTLDWEHIAVVRLRPRRFKPSGPLRRLQRIVALEMVLHEGQVWVIDSAANAADLRAQADQVSRLLGLDVAVVRDNA